MNPAGTVPSSYCSFPNSVRVRINDNSPIASVQMLLHPDRLLTDNDALLLALLDRPQDSPTRLVYADWLEETGDMDLAEWLRLDTWLPRLPNRDRRRHVDRLLELEAAHRDDWLALGGVMVPWERVLSLVVRRLAETIAWCDRAEMPVLRTPEFLPQLRPDGRAIEPLWRCPAPATRTTLVHQVAGRRARRLAKLGLELPRPTLDLGGGRLLLFEPDRAQSEASPAICSDGFLDRYQVPAWDTWLLYLDEGVQGRRRTHAQWEAEWIIGRRLEPAVFASYLVAWVPGPLVAGVDWSCQVQADAPVAWAQDVDCVLTARLRELGLLEEPQRKSAAVTRRQRRVGFLR
jgi:uncharacterized protein (TIGR02996 family)